MNVKLWSGIIVAAAGLAALPSLAHGDTVLLKSGDVISGTITAIGPETVDVTTTFAGAIHIKRDTIKALRSEKAVTIAGGDGQTHSAIVAPTADDAGWHEVDAVAPPIAVAPAAAPTPAPAQPPVAAATHPGKVFDLNLEPDYLPIGPHWKNQLSLGVVNTTGNDESTNFAAEVALNYKDSPSELNLKIGGVYNITDGAQTAGQFYFDGIYRRTLPEWDKSERWYLFGENHELYDHVKAISYRITNSGGLGYYLFKDEKFSLDLRAGPAYVCEKLFDGDSNSAISALAGLRAQYKVNDHLILTQDILYTVSMENVSQYQLTTESAANLKLPELLRGSGLKFAFHDDYDNQVIGGRKNNDTRLTLSWTLDF